jgi:Tfp pilus assembly protein PilX
LEGCSDLRSRSLITSLDRKNGGFFILEMIVGLGLLAVAAFVLVLATSRVHLASSTMADSRQATRAAEATLLQLQADLSLAPTAADTQVRITPLSPASEGGKWQWVEVTATVRGQTRTLTGRVPQKAPKTAPAGGGTP